MSYLTMYILGAVPIFITLFILLGRKVADIGLVDLLIIIATSFIPIFRELVLLFIIFIIFKINNFIIFKKVE